MMALGISKILGCNRLFQAGVHQSTAGVHLSIRLLWVIEALHYLQAHHIRFYRLPDDLFAPGAESGSAANQIAGAAAMIDEVRSSIQTMAIRLSMHPSPGVAPGIADDAAAARALASIESLALLLDALGADRESVIVLHIGGEGNDGAAAIERFAARFERLSPAAQRRVAVEHDGERFGLFAALRLHRFTGIPVIFDALHFQLRNPERVGLSEALGLALATWSPGVRPEVHFSTQRTEAHLKPATRGAPQVMAPRPGQHSDFINPFEFAAFLTAARGLPPFDVMLEAKAGDLALLRLRDDLRRYAPECAALVR
ncbi:UV damage endonuclease UvsE [Roseiflexus castenholzii]|uniref:UV damage endonuclease UvsE n=1 Tax=Roseiflexus castenholzii TaxID=120962 RepID=UPI003C7E91FB